MRENLSRKKLPESAASRALDALNAKEKNATPRVAPEAKPRAELMRIAREKAEKIRARALELQEEERVLAQKRTQEYVAKIQNQGVEEVAAAKPTTRRKVSFEEMEKIADDEESRKDLGGSTKKQEERMGRKATVSALDDREARIAQKNSGKGEVAPPIQEKQEITPRNAEILARAKEIAQKVSAKKVAERGGIAQKKTIEEPAMLVVDEFAPKSTSKNPKNKNENHVLSYEDTGIPLKSAKRKKEWGTDANATRLVSGVEYAAIPEDLEIDTKPEPEKKVRETATTLEVPRITQQELVENDPTVKQLHEEALHEMGFLKDFCKMYQIALVVDEDTLDIVNYETLLRKDLQRLEMTEGNEAAEEFLSLLGIAASAGAAYEFEKNKQIQEEKLRLFREKRKQEEEALPVAEEVEQEEELPEAEEVDEEMTENPVTAQEQVEESEMPTQEVEQEMSEADREKLERDLKASWLVLLRKRRIAKEIVVEGRHLEFDTQLPEKFNFSAHGLIPQNAEEVWDLVKEKGTEMQSAYIRGFLEETLSYINMLEKWEANAREQQGEDQESDEEVGEGEGEEQETKIDLFKNVMKIRAEISRRFPWVKFKNDKVTMKSLPTDLVIASIKDVENSRQYKEGIDNPRTGEKSLKTLRNDLREALVAYESRFDEKAFQKKYEVSKDSVKEKFSIPKIDVKPQDNINKKFAIKKEKESNGESSSENEAASAKLAQLFKKLQTEYPAVKFAGTDTGKRGSYDILNLEEVKRSPEYRDENPKTRETLAEVMVEYLKTLEDVDKKLNLNKWVKMGEGNGKILIREKALREKGYAQEAESERQEAERVRQEEEQKILAKKEQEYATLLQRNPVPKELQKVMEKGEVNIKKYFGESGNAKEAAKRALQEVTKRLEDRKKKGGAFGFVSRFMRADDEYKKWNTVKKQLEHWEKYLR